jgi:hypothetical protein
MNQFMRAIGETINNTVMEDILVLQKRLFILDNGLTVSKVNVEKFRVTISSLTFCITQLDEFRTHQTKTDMIFSFHQMEKENKHIIKQERNTKVSGEMESVMDLVFFSPNTFVTLDVGKMIRSFS